MDYLGILKRSAHIALRNRALWLFGFLVVLFEGGGGNGGGGASVYRYPGEGGRWPGDGRMPGIVWPSAEALPGLVAAVVVVVLFAFLIAILLNMVSNAALMGLVRDVETGQKAGVRRGFGFGFRRFWTYFGVNFVVSVPALVLTVGQVLLGLSPLLLTLWRTTAANAAGAVLTVLLMIPIVLFLVALWAVIELLLEFFLRAAVLERRGVIDALSRGWDVFAANVGRALVMAFLLFGCSILLGLFLIPVAIGLLGGTVAAAVLFWAMTHSLVWTVAVALVLGLPSLIVLAFIGGIYKAFSSGAWTLAYMQLAGLESPAAAGDLAAVQLPEAAAGPVSGPVPEGAVTAGSTGASDGTDIVIDGAAE